MLGGNASRRLRAKKITIGKHSICLNNQVGK
jgi:hypothetical protein